MNTKPAAAKNALPLYVWILAALIAVLAGYYVLGKSAATGANVTKPSLPPADVAGQAPGFTLTDVQGRAVSLADFRGKVVVLDFWATWCPPCRREIPDFITLQSEFGSKGVQFVGIALDEPGNVKAFAQQNGMNYPVLLGDDDVAKSYGGISGIPTTFIIDRGGKIVNRFVGFRPREAFEKEIRKSL